MLNGILADCKTQVDVKRNGEAIDKVAKGCDAYGWLPKGVDRDAAQPVAGTLEPRLGRGTSMSLGVPAFCDQ